MDNEILKLAKYFENIGKEFKKIDFCSNNECSLRDIKIIEFLSEGKKTMSELSYFMNLTKGSMTSAIDSLVEKKFVKRISDKNDKRKVYIQLLKKGEDISKLVYEKHIEISKKILDILDLNEKKEFFKILNKVSSNFK